jgi:hypothetical protein
VSKPRLLHDHERQDSWFLGCAACFESLTERVGLPRQPERPYLDVEILRQAFHNIQIWPPNRDSAEILADEYNQLAVEGEQAP